MSTGFNVSCTTTGSAPSRIEASCDTDNAGIETLTRGEVAGVVMEGAIGRRCHLQKANLY
jgi:hypothetical protein